MINIWMIYANGGERADVVAFNWPICELHPNLSECFLGPLHTRRECGGGGDFTHQKRKKYIKNAGNHPCFCSSQGKRRSSDGRGRPRRGARRLKTQNEIPGGTEAQHLLDPGLLWVWGFIWIPLFIFNLWQLRNKNRHFGECDTRKPQGNFRFFAPTVRSLK